MLCLRLLPLVLLFSFVASDINGEIGDPDGPKSSSEYKKDPEFKMRKSVCTARSKYGKCAGKREMWYFNIYRLRCEKFIYSNCGGNRNRFYNKDECEDYCKMETKEGWEKFTPEIRG